jgi:hypothetical protein
VWFRASNPVFCGDFFAVFFWWRGGLGFGVLLGFLRGFWKKGWRRRGFLVVKRGAMCGECGDLGDIYWGLKNAPAFWIYFLVNTLGWAIGV